MMATQRKIWTACLGVMLSLFMGRAVQADDTEIYTNASNFGGTPLVMMSIDYRSNNLNSTACSTAANNCSSLVTDGYLASTPTTRLGLLKAVLKKVMANLGGMEIGLMVTHDNGTNCKGPSSTQCSNGGYIISGFNEISTSPTDINKLAFYDKLDQFSSGVSGSASHSYQGKELFFEFFRYLTGQDAYNAHLGFKDYGNTNKTTNLDTDHPSLKRDMTIESDSDSSYDTPGKYTSPLSDKCQKVFTVNFAFGVTNQDNDSDTALQETKANQGLDVNLQGVNNKFETVLAKMYGTDFADGTWGAVPNMDGKHNVTSFFVVDPAGVSTANAWAVAGGTTAAYSWSDDAQKLTESLTAIFTQILSTSTTFTAASVPVSVLNRAQVVDNVYIALFKADPDGKKRWPGNVKRLKLDVNNTGTLLDANDTPAVAIDGRIKNTALTYWTVAGSLPAADTTNDEVDGKDGRSVARGGSGQKIPGFTSDTVALINGTVGDGGRKVYYQNGTGTAAFNDLNADPVTASALTSDLGAADATEAEILLQYIRGVDVNDEDGDTLITDARSWNLGDPLHSRPLPINYGARTGYTSDPDLPDIRLVFGTNDGLFHMVRNTASTEYSASNTPSGEEVWAWMPLLAMSNIKNLKTNPVGSHPYGVDGAPAAYVEDANNNNVIDTGDKAWVYFGLRRGGRGMYGLNITDPDHPSQLWAITNTDASGNFSKLGYTFSTPRTGKMNWGGGAKPVVIFAGGYDTNKDSNSTDDSMGNAVYVVDAETGALVWKTEGGTAATPTSTVYINTNMVDSIPSQVTAVDTDGDGLLDRAYVGDTGGRIWRLDMAGTDRTLWKSTVLASVGRHYNNAPSNDRRFFHQPDFVQYKDSTGSYDAVVIGSGNRAHPLYTSVNDFVYMIKDRTITSGNSYTSPGWDHTDFGDITSDCIQTNSCGGSTPDLSNGWKLELEATGEKSLATPTTLARTIFFTTYVPPGYGDNGTCEPNEGTGRLYAVNLDDGSAKNDYSVDNGDTLAKQDRYKDLTSGGVPAEVVYVPFDRVLTPDLSLETVNTTGRWKTYWYKEEN